MSLTLLIRRLLDTEPPPPPPSSSPCDAVLDAVFKELVVIRNNSRSTSGDKSSRLRANVKRAELAMAHIIRHKESNP